LLFLQYLLQNLPHNFGVLESRCRGSVPLAAVWLTMIIELHQFVSFSWYCFEAKSFSKQAKIQRLLHSYAKNLFSNALCELHISRNINTVQESTACYWKTADQFVRSVT